jgi:hypothetical protein
MRETGIMARDSERHGDWQDLTAIVLVLGYIGGFLAAVELAVARLVFVTAF